MAADNAAALNNDPTQVMVEALTEGRTENHREMSSWPERLPASNAPINAGATPGNDSLRVRAREREHILEVLRRVNGSRKQAIALLGISERALRYKLKQYREEGFIH